ncbi:putative polyol transporter 5 [Iris pallida]|uniref:Polyol transporter 5 n=1 Tax=Iris pallida TaxID=29817 RepID=A0AAX6FVP9_IRIPA|nr:putative polyol transporter 5 [Iris pallida]
MTCSNKMTGSLGHKEKDARTFAAHGADDDRHDGDEENDGAADDGDIVCQCWRQAMLEEMSSIVENRTWRLVDLPPGHRPIGLKQVYKLKKDEHGDVLKHRAWLVAKGYVQQV